MSSAGWGQIFRDTKFGFGIGVQDAFGTEQETVAWCKGEMPQIKKRATQYDAERSKESVGSTNAPEPGRVLYDLSLRGKIPGQKSAYDGTSTTPELWGALAFFAFLGGQSAVVPQASSVTSTDANTLVLATSNSKLGSLIAALDTTVKSLGFGESFTGTGPWTWTMFEDSADLAGTDKQRLGTLTLYPAVDDTLMPLTVRVVGESEAQDRRYIDCVPSRIRIFYENSLWMFEIDAVVYGGEKLNDDGGLRDLESYLELGAMNASSGSRFVLGSHGFDSDLDDGTADPEGTCDVRNISFEFDLSDHTILECPPGTEGIGGVVVHPGEPTVTLAVPRIGAFASANPGRVGGATSENVLTDAWNNRTTFSLSCYHGNLAGRVLCINAPALRPMSIPESEFIDGKEYVQAQCKLGHWSGDGGSTDAGNKPIRIGLA